MKKGSLPVDVHRSKTSLLKLPSFYLVLKEVESQVDNFKQITIFQFVNLSVDSVPSLTEIQFWVLANSFLGGWEEGGCGWGDMVYHYTRWPTLVISDQVFFFFQGKRESRTKAKKDRLIAGYNLGYFTAYKYTVWQMALNTLIQKKSVFSDNPLFASLAKLIWTTFYNSGCCFRPLYESFTGVLFLKPFCHYKQT